jgi:hypothetical protein
VKVMMMRFCIVFVLCFANSLVVRAEEVSPQIQDVNFEIPLEQHIDKTETGEYFYSILKIGFFTSILFVSVGGAMLKEQYYAAGGQAAILPPTAPSA